MWNLIFQAPSQRMSGRGFLFNKLFKMNNNFNIRLITTADAAGALEVYAPYVLTTAYSFEYEVPSLATFTKKIEKITSQYPWLVCECNGEIVAYAYGSVQHDRPGYQWTTEATVYMKEAYHRKGIARVLYSALFDMLKMQGYFTVYANVLTTNTGSCAFHKAMGFEEIGIYKNIGYKLGEWRSNLGMQLFLKEHVIDPPIPSGIDDVKDTDAFREILKKANEKV